MKLDPIKEDLDEAVRYDDAPPVQLYLRGLWHYQQGEAAETLGSYLRFIAAMKYRACLAIDKQNVRNASSFVNSPSR